MKSLRPQTGFALVEAVIAITIVAIAAVTIMAQISQASVQSGRSLAQTEALFFANAYLNEIVARPFDDPSLGGRRRAGASDCLGRNSFCNRRKSLSLALIVSTAVRWPSACNRQLQDGNNSDSPGD